MPDFTPFHVVLEAELLLHIWWHSETGNELPPLAGCQWRITGRFLPIRCDGEGGWLSEWDPQSATSSHHRHTEGRKLSVSERHRLYSSSSNSRSTQPGFKSGQWRFKNESILVCFLNLHLQITQGLFILPDNPFKATHGWLFSFPGTLKGKSAIAQFGSQKSEFVKVDLMFSNFYYCSIWFVTRLFWDPVSPAIVCRIYHWIYYRCVASQALLPNFYRLLNSKSD